MTQIKKNILKYLLEMFIVAFGVFLGLYVSEWKSNLKTQSNVEKSMSNIIAELESNTQALKFTIDYHEMIKTNLQKLCATMSESDFNEPYFSGKSFHVMKIENWKGVELPILESIAFEGAKISGVLQEVDIEIVQSISSAYRHIAFNQEFGQTVFNKMLSIDSDTKTVDVVGMVELLTSDVLNSEIALAADLVEIRAKINKLK